MIYAQIKAGNKMHMVEEYIDNYKGTKTLSNPLCGIKVTSYRMTCKLPLSHACKNCVRVFNARVRRMENESD